MYLAWISITSKQDSIKTTHLKITFKTIINHEVEYIVNIRLFKTITTTPKSRDSFMFYFNCIIFIGKAWFSKKKHRATTTKPSTQVDKKIYYNDQDKSFTNITP